MKDSKIKDLTWFIVAGTLETIFTTLKLCNIVTWSWVWVLSPVWVLALLLATIYITIITICIVCLEKYGCCQRKMDVNEF